MNLITHIKHVRALGKSPLKVDEGPRVGHYVLDLDSTRIYLEEREKLRKRMGIFFKIIEKNI